MRWWVVSLVQLDAGDWDVLVQFADGSQLRIVVMPRAGTDLSATIAAAVDARLRGDRRWTPRRDRG